MPAEPFELSILGADLSALIRLSQSHANRLWFVYVWQRNGQTLYVGRTRNPIERLTKHKIIGVSEPLEPTDEINISGFVDRSDAACLERYLLRTRQPLFNRLIPIRKKKTLLTPSERPFSPRNLHANPDLSSTCGSSAQPLPTSGHGGTPETGA